LVRIVHLQRIIETRKSNGKEIAKKVAETGGIHGKNYIVTSGGHPGTIKG